jgi:hypothetical protein
LWPALCSSPTKQTRMTALFWPGHSNIVQQGYTILALLKANCIPDLSFPSQLILLLMVPLTDYILDHPHFSPLPICYVLNSLTSFLYHTLNSQSAPLVSLYVPHTAAKQNCCHSLTTPTTLIQTAQHFPLQLTVCCLLVKWR